MISGLFIRDFKRFETQELKIKALTILAGRNGAGKTSAIHAILLAQQAMQRGDGIVELNGPFGLQLGWFDELVNFNTSENRFYLGLRNDVGGYVEWAFSKGNTELHAVVGEEQGLTLAPFFDRLPRDFQYLSAERDGPRITQKISSQPVELLAVGCHGEFSAQVIEKLGRWVVDEARLFPDVDAPPLVKAQTELWLSSMARPIQIDTAAFAGTDVVSLAFRDPDGITWVRPTNMGFGVSYALPIVLAALTAPDGGLLVVENPEAHLHPAGQSQAGMFLARMAAAGVQVIVETHSDHVLNGVRLAIGEARLSADDAIVHFFSDAKEIVQELAFTSAGGISEWPRGFFDQYQLDIAKISKIRRSK